MKKRLKVIITLAVSAVLIALCAVTAFAWTQQPELPGYGVHYDISHDSPDCCPNEGSGVYGSSHYEQGYYRGYMDCYNQAGGTFEDAQKQAIINEFLASAEYQQRINEAKAQGIEDYKNSEEYNMALLESYNQGFERGKEEYKNSPEYEQSLDAQYSAGVKASYEGAYNLGYVEGSEQMYAKGVSEGYANFRATEEYKNTLQAQYDGGYGAGYTEGVNDAQSAQPSEENTVDISSVISLVLTIILLSGVVIFVFTNKKFKGRKRK